MTRNLDVILVIDVESTCWQGKTPKDQLSEIIEIGLCLLDVATGQRSAPRSIFVKPQRSRLSDYCVELTTITPEMLENGLDFRAACVLLREEYNANERSWASYGDYDRLQFIKQCEEFQVPYPFGRSHINVKNLLALQYQLKREVDLRHGLDLLGLPFEGTLHRGSDDAWNIAAVLEWVLFRGHR